MPVVTGSLNTSFKLKMSARAFHQGYWWPLYTTEWYAPRVSQPVFEPYSLTHVLHGFVMQLVLGRFINYWEGGLAIATGIETAWEVFENSDFVMERFREHSGTSGEYKGDSVQNIGGDILAMVLGYSLGTVFYDAGVWWLSMVWIVASEVSICSQFLIENISITLKILNVVIYNLSI